VRYAKKHQPAGAALLERAGVALGALTHAVVTTGGREARRGHLRAFARAVSDQSAPAGDSARGPGT
jgi:hypothetical protein